MKTKKDSASQAWIWSVAGSALIWPGLLTDEATSALDAALEFCDKQIHLKKHY